MSDDEQGWQWLAGTEHPAPPTTAPGDRGSDDEAWQWVTTARSTTPTLPARAAATSSQPRPGRRVAAVAGTVCAVLVVAAATVAALSATASGPEVSTGPAVETADPTAPSTSAPVVAEPAACLGVEDATVTDSDSDGTDLTAAIAAFQYAYYARRDTAAALAVVAPEAGLDPAALAAAITAVPTGTEHCVGITPITSTAAEVHLVELRPDGRRADYLQLVNGRADDAARRTLITNIQGR
ncbi:hypothetical protein IU469_29965 [Nocardia puris]|uniref:hypothetical protein n=1 Tax=Nocardia puris TaxID=208602 RepID=UPI0018960DF4|nr:hypothetical protein [Nocardia puris]MBF6369906.1 hypothetical protein [Nocardia puris]